MGQQLWSWEAAQFENINADGVVTKAADLSWDVMIEAQNHAWGYRIPLPDEARAFIMWRARLEVRHIIGNISPGLAYLNRGEGISFQIDAAAHRAEFRHALTSSETVRIAVFGIPDASAPFDMLFELNAVTKTCSGTLNGNKVFKITLPFKTVPAFDTLSDVEILTTTPPEEGGGTVGYSELTLQCE
jgi:hypothetical protein